MHISKKHLLHNFEVYKNHIAKEKNAPIKLAPVIKSNAYGHGISLIAHLLEKEKKQDIAFFVVDSLFEAKLLQRSGIRSKILIIGFVLPKNICHTKAKNISFTITSLEQLEAIATTLTHPQHFHIKIDTGMHRQGIMPSEISRTIELITQNKNIILEGICSHLADGENEDETLTQAQIKQWNASVTIWKKHFASIKYTHLSATSGTHHAQKIDANVARLGIGLYGIDQSQHANRKHIDVEPVLEMNTIITSIRDILPGDYVGYSRGFQAKHSMKIATIPVGYFEGLDRRLSNTGSVMIQNTKCPIIGNIGMNISSIDITHLPHIQLGEPVIVISSNSLDHNSIENIATTCHTIPYEILVKIPQHLRRKIKIKRKDPPLICGTKTTAGDPYKPILSK